jgi:hypothetical protein
MAGPRRISGLQKDVFALYRALLRAARKKETEEVRNRLYNVGKNSNNFSHSTSSSIYFVILVRSEFREEAKSVDRNDFRTIEHMLRYGHKQKKLLEMPGFTGAVTVVRNPATSN